MIGTTLAHYTIVSVLGRGGMGEVWKARDAKLGRDVAIKTLPPEFAEDPERLARFEREARLLASLNHPNIATIYGLEESRGTRFIVMELVDGDTLAERVAGEPIPIEKSVHLAGQIALALEAAHDKGVVHRDLKPANIKITPDGQVKVLDFGLAKLAVPDDSILTLSNSPTISRAATQHGVILGTAAYMAPEQARGRAVDKRADIWAFGCVLFECLAGRSAFSGEDISDVLASVLKSDPGWSSLPANLNPRLRDVLHRCLQKDPQKRYRDIGDVRLDLDAVLSDSSGLLASPTLIASEKKRSLMPWVAGFALAILSGVAVWFFKPEPAPSTLPVTSFVHEVPRSLGMNLFNGVLAVSPSGDQFAYASRDGLYIRRMDEVEARRISGTEGESIVAPFFSPNGEWVGYGSVTSNQLKKVRTSGGKPEFLANVANIPNSLFGPSWTVNGWILWVEQQRIMRVPENGGDPSVVVDAKTRVVGPTLLPDGDSLIFTVVDGERSQVMLRSLSSGTQSVLFEDGGLVQYVNSGYLVYSPDNDVFVRSLDLKTRKVGSRVPLIENFLRVVARSAPHFQVSPSGTLVYLRGEVDGALGATGLENLVSLDRGGKAEILPAPVRDYSYPRFSPDGKRIAVQISLNGSNIWIYDIATRALTQLTFDGGSVPAWSPDGKTISFLKNNAIWTVSSDFRGAPSLLPGTEVMGNRGPGSWSPDGDVLLFTSPAGIHAWQRNSTAKTSEVILPSSGGATPFVPHFSSDGRWFAYARSEKPDTAPDIYVVPYPVNSVEPRRMTTGAGSNPVWVRKPQEIIYGVLGDLPGNEGRAFSVLSLPVTTEPSLTRLDPVELFRLDNATMRSGNVQGSPLRPYDVAHDGRRFIVVRPAMPEPATTNSAAPIAAEPFRIHVVRNWFEEVRARVPSP